MSSYNDLTFVVSLRSHLIKDVYQVTRDHTNVNDTSIKHTITVTSDYTSYRRSV